MREDNDMSKLISTWDELKECVSDTHILEISDCNGWIRKKNDVNSNDTTDNYYLSTHTFYDGFSEMTTKLLQACGFDIELANWDKKKEEILLSLGDGKAPRLAKEALLAGLSVTLDSPFPVLNLQKNKRKQSFCHTCIVKKQNPEMCDKCDRRTNN